MSAAVDSFPHDSPIYVKTYSAAVTEEKNWMELMETMVR